MCWAYSSAVQPPAHACMPLLLHFKTNAVPNPLLQVTQQMLLPPKAHHCKHPHAAATPAHCWIHIPHISCSLQSAAICCDSTVYTVDHDCSRGAQAHTICHHSQGPTAGPTCSNSACQRLRACLCPQHSTCKHVQCTSVSCPEAGYMHTRWRSGDPYDTGAHSFESPLLWLAPGA